MQAELRDTEHFLKSVSGFSDLDADLLAAAAASISVTYVRKGDVVLEAGALNTFLYIVFSGAVELFVNGDSFHMRLAEGQCFAYPSLLRDGRVRHQAVAIEDSLLYRMPAAMFHRLCEACPTCYRSFALEEAERLRGAITDGANPQFGGGQDLLDQPLSAIMRRREPVTLDVRASIGDAIAAMVDHDVSSLLITDTGRLVGIVTDKDLRRRVLGQRKDLAQATDTIMTPAPLTLSPADTGFDALMAMTEAHVRHLPLVDHDQQPVGLISLSDVMGGLSHSALFMHKKILAAQDSDAIAESLKRLPPMLVALIDRGARPERIGQLLSSLGDAAHRRAFDLCASDMGITEPIGVLVFGSLARRDQTGVSDQDNGFLLPEHLSDATKGKLPDLAARFTDCLNQAGYVYCGGDIMASNTAWRQTTEGWVSTFEKWMSVPDPKSVMHTTIFFDMRLVGPLSSEAKARFDDLQSAVIQFAQKHPIYLAHLAHDCMRAQIPLGFFRQFVVSRDRAHKNKLDLKHHGTAPIVDLARLYALSAGSRSVDTLSRLQDAADAGVLAEADANDLADAWRFITLQRLKWQADCVRAGREIDNFVDPKLLSHFDADRLRDAFQIVRRAQQAVQLKFAGGGLG